MGIGLVALVFAAAPPDLPLLPPPAPAPMPGKVEVAPAPLLPPRGKVEVAPAPRLPAPAYSMAAIPGGYQITLNRRTAELLQSALENADEKELAAMLKKKAAERKEANPDDETVKTLEMIAFATATQLPGFKKSLAENMGPNGVVITLTGLQAPKVNLKRPRLAKAAEIVRGVMPLLPGEARDTIEALRAMGRTTPLFWKVEPRE
jgi:hypothetical protein